MVSLAGLRERRARRAVLNLLPKHGAGAEIGVWKGDYSARLLSTVRPRTLHLVDPWMVADDDDRAAAAWYGAGKVKQRDMDQIHGSVQKRFAGALKAGTVKIHRMGSEQALAGVADASLDFVYIDGDHSYEGVVADLAVADRVVRPGGFICCDDYLLGSWWKDGVVRPVHEFLASKAVVVAYMADTQIVMRKLKHALVDGRLVIT